MRTRAVLLATLALATCNTTPATRGESVPASSAPTLAREPQAVADADVQFLLTAAATEFKTLDPAAPRRFRDVRVGHIGAPGGTQQPLLCGQFLAAHDGGAPEWAHFVTIKTSDYEQMNGALAASLCQGAAVVLTANGDLSSALQRRLESLR